MNLLLFLLFLITQSDFSLGSTSNCGRAKLFESTSTNETVGAGEFPWLVSIHNKCSNEFICNGHLISKRHVITSGICLFERLDDVSSALIYVVAGRKSLKASSRGAQSRNVKEIYQSKLLKNSIANDISVLVLERPVTLSSTVQPICVIDGKFEGTCLDTESCNGTLVRIYYDY